MKRDRLIPRLVDWVFGFDFFLSYSHGDGMHFPSRLKRRLEQGGFRVFLDQTEYVAGLDLRRETRRQVRKSRKLVVIGRARALKSPWVKREVDVALADGKTPVVVNVNGAVENAPDDAPLAAMAREQHWLRLEEQLDDADGEPSENTISELVRGFDYTRQETKRQRFFATAAAILAIVTCAAIWQAVEASMARVAAEAQRDRAQRVLDQVVATANRGVQALSARVQHARDTGSADRVVPAAESVPEAIESGSALELANSLIERGTALLDRGDFNGARTPLKSALAILESNAQAMPANSRECLACFMTYTRLAEAEFGSGDHEQGLVALAKALSIAKEETEEATATSEWRRRLAATHKRMGAVLLEIGSPADARPHFQDAIALLREPSLAPDATQELADALAQLGDLELEQKQPQTALRLYRETLAILEQQAQTDPANLDLQSAQSVVWQQIVDALIQAEDFDEALIWADRDLAFSQMHLSAAAGDLRRQRDLASSYDRRAKILNILGRRAEALEDYGAGILLLDAVIKHENVEPSFRRDAAAMLESMGRLLGETDVERAIAAFRRALSIREGLAASPEEPAWQGELEAAYRRTSEHMLKIGREAEALETAEQYLLATSLALDGDDSKADRIGRALGTLCWSAVNARSFARALWAGQQAVKLAPQYDWIWLNYAHALMFAGESAQARAIYLSGPAPQAKDVEKWKKAIRSDFDKLLQRRLENSLMAEVNSQLGL